MPMINIEDTYILGETGAQVDKVTGLFTKDEDTTSGEKAFAQLNIGTAGSNRNLLDNPWFTVNQRGFSSGQTGALHPWVDRWRMNSDPSNPATLTFSDGVVTVSAPSGGFCNILQTLSDPSSIVGKVVTLSVLKSDGTIISGTITRIAGTTQDAYSAGGITLRLSSTNRFAVQADSGASISIKACKLELGSVSTLTNDAPPDYGTELAKCQRYFVRYKTSGSVCGLGFAYAHSTTNLTAIVSLPCPMRTNPSITSSGQGMALQQGTVRYNLTSPTGALINNNVLIFTSPYTVQTGAATAGQVGGLLLRENSTVDLSADL